MRRFFLIFWMLSMLAFNAHSQKQDIHIVSANDMHATIWAFPQLAAIVDSLRQEYPHLLIFSAGDNRTGDPLNDKYEIPAYPMVALMNQVGFNASALGNHEFDVHSLARLTELSNFRYLCANMQAAPESGIHTIPYQVFDVAGLKVGVIGVIQLSPQGIPSTHPDNLKGLSFQPASEVVGQYEWLSKDCDVTILLSHLGYEEDRAMAEAYPWLDLIIGGHTHTQLKGNETQNGVLITQNKNKLPCITHITLTVDSGQVVSRQSEYISLNNYPKKNKIVEEMVRFFSDNPSFRRVLSQAATPFETKEELGCMMCDAFMAICQADIALENPGGVRIDGIPAGDITVRQILELDPFDNQAVVLELTGYELERMMRSYCHDRLFSFPYVGGIRCQIFTKKDNPRIVEKIKLLTLDGKPLNMKRRYRVATNSYVSSTSEIPDGRETVLNTLTADLIMEYLEQQDSVDYKGTSRLEVMQ